MSASEAEEAPVVLRSSDLVELNDHVDELGHWATMGYSQWPVGSPMDSPVDSKPLWSNNMGQWPAAGLPQLAATR